MRRGIGNPQFVYSGDKAIGIHIPANFCAEHEWGIEELKKKFGITNGKSTLVPKIVLVHDRNMTYLFICKYMDNKIPSELNPIRDGLSGAWDDSSFGIGTDRKDYGEFLVKLKEEIDNCNVKIFLGKSKGISNAGLVIEIC